MKSLTELWMKTAEELAVWCHTSVALDCKKLESRVEKEGVSFLTITLPGFAKEFERALDAGRVSETAFTGFKTGKGGLPLFLGGFLSQIFDTSSGALVQEPNIDSIFAVRQLTLMYSKILLPCSDARTAGAMKGFLDCEQELREVSERISDEDLQDFRRISSLLFGGVFAHMDKLVHDQELRPRHGPGATADGLLGNEKFDQRTWHQRLESVFPYGDFALPNWRYYYQLDLVEFLEPGAERPVKVTAVPKTLKTPRIIAIEPTCMQYMQQALLGPLVESLESKTIGPDRAENLSREFLGFTDQHPNRELARVASRTGELATLDLSEASDRVLNRLVVNLLHRFPHFSEAVQATRSTRACVPLWNGDRIVELEKFASMGSALCFPFEAMVFLTIVFMGVERELRTPLTRKLIKSYRGKIRVYGDDIIVPADSVPAVIGCLSAFGAKVNANKSFWTGKFRESCGGDYYDGELVTPVRFRRQFPKSRHDVPEVISLVEFRNLMYNRGFWKTAAWLDEKIVRLLRRFPIVQAESPGLGRTSFLPYEGERLCGRLHRPLVKAWVPYSRPPQSNVSGEGALLKCLLKQGEEPFADSKHLERQGRPRAVGIKLSWVVPY